jgi:uncharacterized protein
MGWVDQRGSEVLTRNECFRLLAVHAGGVGRVGLLESGRVVIEPVLYRMLGRDVLFQIGPGSMLEAAEHPSIVSFEVDNLAQPEGWSVLVRGLLRRVDEGAEAQARPLGVKPLVPKPGTSFVMIRSDTVSGRRFHTPTEPPSTSARGSRALGEVRLQAPITVPRGASLREAAAAMEARETSAVLLGADPAWLVGERDLTSALAAGLAADAPAAEVATRAPLSATTTTTVADAAAMMADRCLQHLLIVSDDGTPVGVLSQPELLRHILEEQSSPNSEDSPDSRLHKHTSTVVTDA